MAQASNTFSARVIETAFSLAERRGWDRVSLGDIAQRAGISLADLYEHFPDKAAILAALTQELDRQTLKKIDKLALSEVETARDRLFDVLMTRFEVMRPYRAGLAAVMWSRSARNPFTALQVLPRLARSLHWMLEAADIPLRGTIGNLRLAALMGAWVATFWVWLGDDSADLGPTMAALDKQLARLGRLERWCAGFGGYEAHPHHRTSFAEKES